MLVGREIEILGRFDEVELPHELGHISFSIQLSQHLVVSGQILHLLLIFLLRVHVVLRMLRSQGVVRPLFQHVQVVVSRLEVDVCLLLRDLHF